MKISLTAALLLSAAACFVFFDRYHTPAETPPPEPAVYRGSFPGVPETSGLFTMGMTDFCQEFTAGPAETPWITAASALMTGQSLEIDSLKFRSENFTDLIRWSRNFENISGTWQNKNGGTGTFKAANGRWNFESTSVNMVFDETRAEIKETFASVTDIELPDYSGTFPHAPGSVILTKTLRLPEMDLQKTELSTRYWDLYITGSGEWLMTRSMAGEIMELADFSFDSVSIAGSNSTADLRWSAGRISKNPLEKSNHILHAITGSGLACSFSATGPGGTPAQWRFSAFNCQKKVIWGNMQMQLQECTFNNASAEISGTIKAGEIELFPELNDIFLKIPSAELTVHPDGSVYGRALQNTAAVYEGKNILLTGVTWKMKNGTIEEIKGTSGKGEGFSWQEFTLSGTAGTFREFSAGIPGGHAVTSRLEFRKEESQYKIFFSNSAGECGGFLLATQGGTLTAGINGRISGEAINCAVTNPLYPSLAIREGTVSFDFSAHAHREVLSCRLTGTVYNSTGKFADMEMEYYPETAQWRGKALTIDGLSAILLHDAGSSGWIIPLPGIAVGDFPASLLKAWHGISISGIGAFEYDSTEGTVINMIDALCTAGNISFNGLRGVWQAADIADPCAENTLSGNFDGINIPGTETGTFSGRLTPEGWIPEKFSIDLLAGKCEFLGIMDEGMWLFNISNAAGSALAEGFFGMDQGTGWDDFSFSGSGIYDPAAGQWNRLSLSGIPADGGASLRISVPKVVDNMAEDISGEFLKAFLADCIASNIAVEYSLSARDICTEMTARPANPLNFTFSGDPEKPFTIPEKDEPGFSGTIEVEIHLPLTDSNGILCK